MIEYINMTPFASLAFGSSEREGEIDDVIIAKALFSLSPAGSNAAGITHQPVWMVGEEELLVSDQFFGETNRSSLRSESDLAPYKPLCDVIVIGSAHSPTGKPISKVHISVDIVDGKESILHHRLEVFGKRELIRRDAIDRGAATFLNIVSFGTIKAPEWHLSEPEPFMMIPLRYELAYGGEVKIYSDESAAKNLEKDDLISEEAREKHPEKARPPIAHEVCHCNPVGCGYSTAWYIKATRSDRLPAPQIEAASTPFTAAFFASSLQKNVQNSNDFTMLPKGLGAFGKTWHPRVKFAGTYDENWKKNIWPYLPEDFNMLFWNGAHPDMQCRHLFGDETVTLTNLLSTDSPGVMKMNTGESAARFKIPSLNLYLRLKNEVGGLYFAKMPIDTTTIDLEKMLLTLVWRALIPHGLPFVEASLIALGLDKRLDETLRSMYTPNHL